MYLDAVGYRVEPQDRIGLPVDTGDPCIVEGHGLVQRPAHRLHDRAFDLVDQPVRIDHLTAIDRRYRAHQTRTPGLLVHFHLGGNGAISREILVARKGKAESAILGRLLTLLPTEALRRLLDHIAPAPIVEMS